MADVCSCKKDWINGVDESNSSTCSEGIDEEWQLTAANGTWPLGTWALATSVNEDGDDEVALLGATERLRRDDKASVASEREEL